MATPQITLTATLDTLTGIADSKAKLRITLVNFGGFLPRVAGTAMLAKRVYEVTQTGPSISLPIWGNDVITPAGTFYCIEIIDSKGVRVQAGNYLLTGGGTLDLSNLPQYFPPDPVPAPRIPVYTNPPGGATQTINGDIIIDGNLTVTGTINGGGGAVGLVIVAPAPNIVFDGNVGSGFKCTLNQDVSLTIAHMANRLYVAILFEQDGTGGHSVTWPGNVYNHGEVNPGPGMKSSQVFMCNTDGSLIAVSNMQYS